MRERGPHAQVMFHVAERVFGPSLPATSDRLRIELPTPALQAPIDPAAGVWLSPAYLRHRAFQLEP